MISTLRTAAMLKKIPIFLLFKIISESFALLVVPATSPTRHQFIVGIGVPLNLENEAITYGWTLKAQYFLPESTADDLKWVYWPGFWGDTYTIFPPKNKVKFAVNSVSNIFEQTQYDDFPFPLGGKRKRREIKRDNYTGQAFESYNVEVKEIGNENLDDESFEVEYDDHDDSFDDMFYLNANQIPKHRDLPIKTKEELSDTSGTRWLLYDGLGRLLNEKGLEGRHCVLRSICEAAESNFGYHGGLFGQLFHIIFT